MPAPFSHGAAGASAESTVRDQLAGERNVRDADSLVDATDNSEAQQQHPYCRLLAPHLHSYAALFADSRRLWSCDHHVTCVDKLRFALCLYILVQTTVGVWYVHFDSECLCPEVQKLVSRSLALSYFYLCNYVRFKAKYWWLYVCSCAYIVWGDGGDEMSPSTHLRAGHLASHLKKKNKTSLSNMTRFEISCCMSLMHSLRTLTYFVEH